MTLWRALQDVQNGFYIDIGAWDPDRDTVTRAFSERGWRGINVEPLPGAHGALQRRRPRDFSLLAAAGAADGTAMFYEVEGTGLSTTDPALAAQHEAAGLAVRPRKVEVLTLATICARHAPAEVHFLKLDCEGGERAALEGADFTRCRPWVVLVEATEPNSQQPTHAAWEAPLLNAGYRFVWFDELNRFYVAAEHHDLLASRLARPPSIWDNFVRAAPLPPAPLPAPPSSDPSPDVAITPPATLDMEGRIALAQRCRDCDDVPKVPGAGQVQTLPDGTAVQLMHNGLLVPADGYCGPWMTRLIRLCHGHHEPQEELLFHQAVQGLALDATMIELGGYWAYYTAWFLHGAPHRRAVVLEPDPQNRAVGERTLALNGLAAPFVAATAGAAAPPAPFETERSGVLLLPSRSVPDLMAEHGIDHLDLLHCDIQGAELATLEAARDLLSTGRIGLLFVSTHAYPISGDPLTHQRCLNLLRECGCTIEAEHDAWESYSGDGLIVARTRTAPPGGHGLPISFARRSEALFRDPLYDLAAATQDQASAEGLAPAIVQGVFESVLFRPPGPSDLAVFGTQLRATGDVGGFLQAVLKSPEAATRQPEFEAAYFGRASAADAWLLVPTDSPFACSALHLTLTRDTPLGRRGDHLVVPRDAVILPALLANGAWNAEHVAFLEEHLDPSRRYTLVDIGANIGLFTRQVLNACPNIEAAYCVEPDPLNYAALVQNLDRPAPPIHFACFALGAEAGTLKFFRDTENCGNNSLHADAMRGRPFTMTEVPVEAAGPWLDERLAGDGPIVWKSDTQGNDEAILAATPWPVWHRVQAAILELWRIQKAPPTPDFLARIADMPNRRLGGAAVSAEDVARYLDSDDWTHDDLYLWR